MHVLYSLCLYHLCDPIQLLHYSAAAVVCHTASGNIGEVTQLSECEYDIKIRPDTNNNRHRLWFYFSVHTTLCQQVVNGWGLELRGCHTHIQYCIAFVILCLSAVNDYFFLTAVVWWGAINSGKNFHLALASLGGTRDMYDAAVKTWSSSAMKWFRLSSTLLDCSLNTVVVLPSLRRCC